MSLSWVYFRLAAGELWRFTATYLFKIPFMYVTNNSKWTQYISSPVSFFFLLLPIPLKGTTRSRIKRGSLQHVAFSCLNNPTIQQVCFCFGDLFLSIPEGQWTWLWPVSPWLEYVLFVQQPLKSVLALNRAALCR